jgi:hypothetical protein
VVHDPIDPTVVLARATPEGDAEYRALITQLRHLWADLEPIPQQPRLSRVDVKSGIWVVMCRKDYHAETGTYLTYRVYRQLFVPLFFLGAYRVYETLPGSLVFVGRHPLPLWATTWNAVVGAAVVLLAYAAAVTVIDRVP